MFTGGTHAPASRAAASHARTRLANCSPLVAEPALDCCPGAVLCCCCGCVVIGLLGGALTGLGAAPVDVEVTVFACSLTSVPGDGSLMGNSALLGWTVPFFFWRQPLGRGGSHGTRPAPRCYCECELHVLERLMHVLERLMRARTRLDAGRRALAGRCL